MGGREEGGFGTFWYQGLWGWGRGDNDTLKRIERREMEMKVIRSRKHGKLLCDNLFAVLVCKVRSKGLFP